MNIVTLKRPIAVQVHNPIKNTTDTWFVKVLAVRETLGYDPITAFCTDVARLTKEGNAEWYAEWFGKGGAVVTVTYPSNNVEGEQVA